MFEKEISGYAFNITKRYTGERVKLSTLISDVELPEDFKKFAEAEVEELMDQEKLGESRTGKFDLSSPDIQALFKEVRHILKNSHEFSREEFLELADKASKFVFNYVIRPRWTLEKFLFKGEQQIGRSSIAKVSRFFNCYSYYPKGITEYLDFHGKSELDIETWRRLHSKIDEHLLSTLPAKLNSLTSPMFKLFEFSSGAEKVPSDAMVLFFRDKSATDIVDRIEFAKDVKSIRSLDVMTLAMILEASSREVSQNIAVLPASEEPPKEFRSFERQKVTHPLRPEESAPLKASEVTNESPAPPPSAEHGKPAAAPKPEPLTPPEERRGATAASVRTLMSAKLEEKIVKKIFHGSKSGYQIAVHRIDESMDWRGAAKIVEGIFIDNDVDPFSKYAVAFTDAVNAKFRSTRSSAERS
jgi:hypothetical protein